MNTRPDHVQTRTEQLAEALQQIVPRLTRDEALQQATYVLGKLHENYAHDVRLGLEMGRKEMLAVMETVIGEDVKPNMSSPDLHKIQSGQNRLRKYQRGQLARLVAAVSKSTEAKK